MLKVPGKNVTLVEFSTSTMWVGESGVLYSISKKVPKQTLAQAKETIIEFRKHFGDKKFCMLVDVTHSSETSLEVRSYAAEELPKIVKAIAMVSRSVLGKMLANLFFNLKSQPYPAKMFNDETEAKAWLRQYL